MIVLFVSLPFLLFSVMRIALIDPRLPGDNYSKLGMTITIVVGILPTFFFWAPASALYNASLVFALSVVISPLLFSSMKTDTKSEWVKDKVFLIAARTAFAAGTASALTFFDSWWFLILAGFTVFSFVSRCGLWIAASGSPGKYFRAVFISAIILTIYYIMVNESKLTPYTWTDWKGYLQPSLSRLPD